MSGKKYVWRAVSKKTLATEKKQPSLGQILINLPDVLKNIVIDYGGCLIELYKYFSREDFLKQDWKEIYLKTFRVNAQLFCRPSYSGNKWSARDATRLEQIAQDATRLVLFAYFYFASRSSFHSIKYKFKAPNKNMLRIFLFRFAKLISFDKI